MKEIFSVRRKTAFWAGAAIALAAVAGSAAWIWHTGMYVFKDVRGPAGGSHIAEPVPARIEDFASGGTHRLAVLVTDRNSGWLGLARGFKAHGVPFILTTDPARALRHHVVVVYPIVSGKALPAEALRGLAQHVHSGRTLIANHLAGGGLEAMFGVTGALEGRGRKEITWASKGSEPEEAVTRVSGAGEEQMGSVGYTASTAQVLGTFDDGSAAITCHRTVGRACLVGVDVGAFAQRAMNGRGESVGRRFVNGYEPSLDSIIRWVRDVYLEDEPMPWRLSTVPGDRALALVMSHDVDYGESLGKSEEFAAALVERGVRGTFFVQTKYLRDFNDSVFFDDAAVATVKRIAASGMEIGSHTVSHAVSMKAFEVGTGEERYPDYRPQVQSRKEARGATVMGEARVSRFLLETLVGVPVASFRPGHLSYPRSLPQVLEATGYHNSSTLTANAVGSHLPFQLTHDRGDIALSRTYEFPVTIEDEHAPRLGDRIDAANHALTAIARHQGHAVNLVHPNIADHKLRFVEQLVDAWKGAAWIGTLAELGAWWRARDEVQVDMIEKGGAWVMEVSGAVKGLVVHRPKHPEGSVELK